MRSTDLVRAALVTAAAAALVTGCTSDTGGTGTGATTSAESEVSEIFNPCAGLSDQVLTDVGLDPATKTVVTDPPSGPSSWRVCGWQTPDELVRVDVFSTSHTLDEARSNADLVQKVETTVGQRQALQAYDKAETDGRSCYTSMEAEQGMFEVVAAWFEEDGWTRDICEVSNEFATALDPHLPK